MKKLGFGCMRLPLLDAQDRAGVDIERTKQMVDMYMGAGFNYFDTAATYHLGNSEIAMREALTQRYARDTYTITDKLSLFKITTAEELPAFFDEQLEKLGVEYIDNYLVHSLGISLYEKAQALDAFDFVRAKKAQGKIKHIGFSFHDKAELLDEILTAHPYMEYVQLQINYLDWEDPTIEARKCYEVARRHATPILVMEPIKGGALANVPQEVEELFESVTPGASPASWAVRFAASLEGVEMVLSGMTTMEQVQDNIAYMADFQPLNEAEQAAIEKAREIIKNSITVPCTSCRYCVVDCPAGIAIPEYFALYNNLKQFGERQRVVTGTYYYNLAQSHGRASACIGCGKCETICPQHIEVRKHLADIAQILDV